MQKLKRSLLRNLRRRNAELGMFLSVESGVPGSITLGNSRVRRTLHLFPDGTSACHRGVHCVCCVNWLLARGRRPVPAKRLWRSRWWLRTRLVSRR